MGNLLQVGAAWLEGQRVKHCSQLVTYRRGINAVEVAASIGKTEFELVDGYAATIRTESRDYLILAGDLVLNGVPVLPERGDQILESVGDNILIYEVVAPGNEPHFRYSDPFRMTLRIHTKQIGQEPTP